MTPEIKKIEDLSLNAWPSWQMQVYDGWILRFSHFYTHRTNCVEQLGPSSIPLSEKIPYCEEIYRRWETPCIFKISPVGDPDLDGLLAARGYGIEHETTVMLHDFPQLPRRKPLDASFRVRVLPHTDDSFLDGLFRLKGDISGIHRKIVPQMYAAIPKDEIAVSVFADDRIVGTGLGILDRDTVGVYAIHTDPDFRRMGIASHIVRTILDDAAGRGISAAYLQVVSDNAPARALYRGLGFRDSYRYYFRVRGV